MPSRGPICCRVMAETMLDNGSPRHMTSLKRGGSFEGIGSGHNEPSGRIGLATPPKVESKPLRLRISFIAVRSRVTRHRYRPLHLCHGGGRFYRCDNQDSRVPTDA